MRLVVRQSDSDVQELSFKEGPIYIGRQAGSTLVIQDLGASRQHAVLFATQDGDWIVEDLDSTNKTYLNDNAIHKSRLKDGDTIRIAGMVIEVYFDVAAVEPEGTAEPIEVETPEPVEPPIEVSEELSSIHLEETMVAVHHDVVAIHRTIDAKKGEPIQMPARRFGDLDRAAATFCHARDLRTLHRAVLEVMIRQLHAYHGWVALRKSSEGGMDVEGGRDVATIMVKRQDLVLQQVVVEALEKGTYQLVPQLPRQIGKGKIRSVIAAPVLRENGCFGVLYTENSTDHEHYTREDLDYLILLSILVAAVIEKV